MNSRTLPTVWVRAPGRLLPHDFLGILLLLFITGSITLFGEGRLMALGLLLAGSYSLNFLKQKRPIPTEMMVYFMWVFWSLTGFMVSRDQEAFRNTMMLVAQIWVMTFAVAGVTMKRGTIGTNFLALIIGGMVVIVSSIVTGDLDLGGRMRLQGMTANPNHFAYILLIAVMASLYFLRHNFRPITRIFVLIVMSVCSYGIILSASRKAFIGLIFLILFWGLMCYGREIIKRKSYLATLLVIALALVLLTNYMLSNTFMGYRFKYDFVKNPITMRHDEHKRVTFYKEGLEAIKGNPLFGIGLGNFHVISRYSTYSHSDYIEVATSTGVVGFALYFSVYVLLWRRLGKIWKSTRDRFIRYNVGLLKASILVILLLSVGRPNLYSQITWVFMGSAIGYAWHLQRQIDTVRRHNATFTGL